MCVDLVLADWICYTAVKQVDLLLLNAQIINKELVAAARERKIHYRRSRQVVLGRRGG